MGGDISTLSVFYHSTNPWTNIMCNNIPDNHLYIQDNIDIYIILKLKNDAIVNMPIHIITKPIRSEDLALITHPIAYCIQDIHDIIRQQHPSAQYNLALEFNYTKENLLSSEGWVISTQSTNPSIVTQYFIRQPQDRGRHQLRCVTATQEITPTKTFIACVEENTTLFDAHYHFVHAHPDIIWYESGMYSTIPFPHISNAELEVAFFHSDKNTLTYTIKLHAYDYHITIEPNINEDAINNIINKTPITPNISQHEYIALIRWLRQLPHIYNKQITPLLAETTKLFYTHYAPHTPSH